MKDRKSIIKKRYYNNYNKKQEFYKSIARTRRRYKNMIKELIERILD